VTAEWKVFGGVGVFFVVTAALYWFTSYEDAGSVFLLLCMVALVLIAGYLFVIGRRLGPRPSDRGDAVPAEGAGTVGYFPSSSLWPFLVGAGAVVLANGLVFGLPVALAGAALLVSALVGYALEAQHKLRS
jgi:hypothetical protein